MKISKIVWDEAIKTTNSRLFVPKTYLHPIYVILPLTQQTEQTFNINNMKGHWQYGFKSLCPAVKLSRKSLIQIWWYFPVPKYAMRDSISLSNCALDKCHFIQLWLLPNATLISFPFIVFTQNCTIKIVSVNRGGCKNERCYFVQGDYYWTTDFVGHAVYFGVFICLIIILNQAFIWMLMSSTY